MSVVCVNPNTCRTDWTRSIELDFPSSPTPIRTSGRRIGRVFPFPSNPIPTCAVPLCPRLRISPCRLLWFSLQRCSAQQIVAVVILAKALLEQRALSSCSQVDPPLTGRTLTCVVGSTGHKAQISLRRPCFHGHKLTVPEFRHNRRKFGDGPEFPMFGIVSPPWRYSILHSTIRY